jgi:hypothetical protein
MTAPSTWAPYSAKLPLSAKPLTYGKKDSCTEVAILEKAAVLGKVAGCGEAVVLGEIAFLGKVAAGVIASIPLRHSTYVVALVATAGIIAQRHHLQDVVPL